ncbi:MAG: ribose 5-phosphate isomerase B [Bacillota bacterium]
MKVALAADHAGFALKETAREFLQARGFLIKDFGTYSEDPVDYPDLAARAARAVQQGECTRGILFCGTGVGVAITANKLKGIRAACCTDCYTAACAREHNDANILTLGTRVTGPGLAMRIIEVFLQTPFAGGRHLARIEKIRALEDKER